MGTDSRTQITFRMDQSTKQKIDQSLDAANCRTQNEFIEKAVNDYADRLALVINTALPRAVSIAIDSRLSQLEKQLSGYTFRYAVLLDMIAGILADGFELSEDDLKRRRKASVLHVKELNGRISLERSARDSRGDDAL